MGPPNRAGPNSIGWPPGRCKQQARAAAGQASAPESVDAEAGERNLQEVKRLASTSRERTILVTAFEPFGARTVNRSQLVLEHIARAAATPKGIRPGARVVTRALPVSFDKLDRALDRALACKPDAVLLMGESAGAEELRLERLALNRIDARIPDNDGVQPEDERVVDDGPAAYFSTLPLQAALTSVRRAGAPASLSGNAGLYACNYAYYLTLHKLHGRDGGDLPVIFVHIPVKSRAVALRTATRGMLAMVRHLIDRSEAATRPPARRRTASKKARATPAGGRKA